MPAHLVSAGAACEQDPDHRCGVEHGDVHAGDKEGRDGGGNHIRDRGGRDTIAGDLGEGVTGEGDERSKTEEQDEEEGSGMGKICHVRTLARNVTQLVINGVRLAEDAGPQSGQDADTGGRCLLHGWPPLVYMEGRKGVDVRRDLVYADASTGLAKPKVSVSRPVVLTALPVGGSTIER